MGSRLLRAVIAARGECLIMIIIKY